MQEEFHWKKKTRQFLIFLNFILRNEPEPQRYGLY